MPSPFPLMFSLAIADAGTARSARPAHCQDLRNTLSGKPGLAVEDSAEVVVAPMSGRTRGRRTRDRHLAQGCQHARFGRVSQSSELCAVARRLVEHR